MDTVTKLTAAVAKPAYLEVVMQDGKTQTFTLIMDYAAIIKAEQETGRNFADPSQWELKNLTGKDLTALCWAALDCHHPDITLTEVRRWLAPAQQGQLYVMLLEQCFPGTIDNFNSKNGGNATNGKPRAGERAPNTSKHRG